MTPKQEFQTLVDKMPSLALAINGLVQQKEKKWGFFQIKKAEDKIYQLSIPSLPILKLKVSSNHTYRAFWGNNNKSSVYTRHKQEQKTRTLSKTNYQSPKSDRSVAINSKPLILSDSKISSKSSLQQPELISIKQDIYEVVYYKTSITPEIDLVNKMLAGFLREKIEQLTAESSLAADEMMPLVLMTEKI
ncbi:MAG: hypothetical protein ACFCU5_13025 [Pleurocapsa sp.]